jgi:lipopolysaccharide export system permease protein
LYDHAAYLDKQSIDSSEYRLAFWQKALQPLATLSLVIIAISFVLGPLRQVTMGFRVFVGVLVGLVFQTSLKMLGPTSIILGFPPVFAVLTPILVCFVIGWALMRRAQ